jgi:23S rRNA (cytosine1962-C5)-methyltransferase
MSDFIFAEKPSGFNTHQSHPWRLGFVEYLEQKNHQKYFIVSRLDQGTSGVIVLPTSSAAAEKMTSLFEEKVVKKIYYFLTDRSIDQHHVVVKTFIDKVKGNFQNIAGREPNSETAFHFEKKIGRYFLWKAEPATGKSHQIRLHAEQLGIPILGDSEHGGSEFYRLCLHCQELEFQWDGKTAQGKAKPPVWFENGSEQDWIFKEALLKRELLLEKEVFENECYRLVHQESKKFSIDVFGPQAWAYRYNSSELESEEREFWLSVSKRIGRPLLVKAMANRGQDPHAGQVWKFGDFQETWEGIESEIRYEFRSSQGQSPGLFLDQRENRKWVASHATGKKVLNLFAYTGGFSVVAAKSGASEVTTVDVSKNFLEWTKKNFTLNGLEPAKFQFWESDVLFFLKGSLKKQRTWDLIVCDPPSFGRSKEGVFKIDKDLPRLIESLVAVLSPKGKILFSTNYEQWSMHDLHKLLSQQKALKGFSIEPAPGPGWDFELSEDPVMKSFIFSGQRH